MNLYESETAAHFDRCAALLESANALTVCDSDWAAAAQAEFEAAWGAGMRWLGGHWEGVPGSGGPPLAWSPSAVGADLAYEFVWHHADKVNRIFAEEQVRRADQLKQEWDAELLRLYRARTRPASTGLESFRARCQAARPDEREDLRRELGKLPFSWEEKQALKQLLRS